MKTCTKNLFYLLMLVAGVTLIPAGRVTAQTFTTLYSFSPLSVPFSGTNSDGAFPYAGVVLSGSTLYGTTERGGVSHFGTVFKVNTDGTGFTTLHTFPDGGTLWAGLIISGNTLYGTAQYGGSSGSGTVFRVNTDGTAFTNIYNFTGGGDGLLPKAGLILSGNTLYGTAKEGGSSPYFYGTVFKVTTIRLLAPQHQLVR